MTLSGFFEDVNSLSGPPIEAVTAVQLDRTPPAVIALAFSTSTGAFSVGAGDKVAVDLAFSEAVDTPDVTIAGVTGAVTAISSPAGTRTVRHGLYVTPQSHCRR